MINDTVKSFIDEHGFGMLISSDLQVTQVPLIVQSNDADSSVIIGHMARANPQWQNLSDQMVTAVFTGPHAYISPTWYANTPAVPTWNYVSVQCTGRFTLLSDHETLEAVELLAMKYEPELLDNNDVMTDAYVNKLIKAVVGFKIKIEDIKVIEKLGQKKRAEDQLGVFQALKTSDVHQANQLAAYMAKRNLGTGQEA